MFDHCWLIASRVSVLLLSVRTGLFVTCLNHCLNSCQRVSKNSVCPGNMNAFSLGRINIMYHPIQVGWSNANTLMSIKLCKWCMFGLYCRLLTYVCMVSSFKRAFWLESVELAIHSMQKKVSYYSIVFTLKRCKLFCIFL